MVGYLHQGTNWVLCQEQGSQVTSGNFFNHWWAYTQADNNAWGWVNAVWAQGGDNNAGFDAVSGCRGTHGSPPPAIRC